MKKVIGLGVLLVAACHGANVPKSPAPSAPGAASAPEAVTALLAAAKAGDLQAFSAVWGDANGSVRGKWDRDQLEQREVYNMRCLRNDKSLVISTATSPQEKRVLTVQITFGALTRSTTFTVTQANDRRWYVETWELDKLNDICLAR